jgi:hypothetical protein
MEKADVRRLEIHQWPQMKVHFFYHPGCLDLYRQSEQLTHYSALMQYLRVNGFISSTQCQCVLCEPSQA